MDRTRAIFAGLTASLVLSSAVQAAGPLESASVTRIYKQVDLLAPSSGAAPASETEISPVSSFTKVSTGNSLPSAVMVNLPFSAAGFAEQAED